MVSLGIHRRSAVRMPGARGRGSRRESGADPLVPLLDLQPAEAVGDSPLVDLSRLPHPVDLYLV